MTHRCLRVMRNGIRAALRLLRTQASATQRRETRTHLMYTKKIPLIAIGAIALLTLAGCSTGSLSSGGDDAGATAAAAESEVTVGTVGVQGDIQDISEFCGDKDLTVALADGFG